MTTDDETGKALPEGYSYLRQELRFEHTLLGSRMTYYMTSQSFLFTAAAIGRATHWHGVYWFSGVMLPIVGARSRPCCCTRFTRPSTRWTNGGRRRGRS